MVLAAHQSGAAPLFYFLYAQDLPLSEAKFMEASEKLAALIARSNQNCRAPFERLADTLKISIFRYLDSSALACMLPVNLSSLRLIVQDQSCFHRYLSGFAAHLAKREQTTERQGNLFAVTFFAREHALKRKHLVAAKMITLFGDLLLGGGIVSTVGSSQWMALCGKISAVAALLFAFAPKFLEKEAKRTAGLQLAYETRYPQLNQRPIEKRLSMNPAFKATLAQIEEQPSNTTLVKTAALRCVKSGLVALLFRFLLPNFLATLTNWCASFWLYFRSIELGALCGALIGRFFTRR